MQQLAVCACTKHESSGISVPKLCHCVAYRVSENRKHRPGAGSSNKKPRRHANGYPGRKEDCNASHSDKFVATQARGQTSGIFVMQLALFEGVFELMKRPWMPVYVDDFRMDTLSLAADEIGVYFTLLCLAWRNGDGSITGDMRELKIVLQRLFRDFHGLSFNRLRGGERHEKSEEDAQRRQQTWGDSFG